jgi:hypothetical protein
MKLDSVQDQAIQARMALIVGAKTFDRLFAGIRFDELDGYLLYLPRTRERRPRSRMNSRCTSQSSPLPS